jgi:hypothetical protein
MMHARTPLMLKLLQGLVSLLLLVWLLSRYSLSLTDLRPASISLWHLLAAVLISLVLIQSVAVLRWRLILHSLGVKAGFSTLLGINLTAIFWGAFLPSSDGFAALRVLFFSRRFPAASAAGAAAVVYEKLVGFVLLTLWAMAGTLVVSQANLPFYLLFWGMVPIALLLLLVIPLPSLRSHSPFYFCAPAFRWIKSLRRQFSLLPQKRLLPPLLPLILTVQIFSFCTIFLLFRAVGVQVPFFRCILIVPLAQLIALIPVSLGGFGVREAAFVALFASSGVDAASAISVSVLSFLVLTAAPAVVGGVLSVNSGFSAMRSRV